MHDARSAFIKNPSDGLGTVGWPTYAGYTRGATLVELFPDNNVPKPTLLEDPKKFDAAQGLSKVSDSKSVKVTSDSRLPNKVSLEAAPSALVRTLRAKDRPRNPSGPKPISPRAPIKKKGSGFYDHHEGR
jgi:hypothetical protein